MHATAHTRCTPVARSQRLAAPQASRRHLLGVALGGAAVTTLMRGAVAQAAQTHSFLGRPGQIVVLPQVSDSFLEENKVRSWETWSSEVMVKTYPYVRDEEFWFVKGEAVVTPISPNGSRGTSMTIKAGDFAIVSEGMTVEWDVKDPIFKHWREFE